MKVSPMNQRIKLLSTSTKLSSFKDYEQALREVMNLGKSHE